MDHGPWTMLHGPSWRAVRGHFFLRGNFLCALRGFFSCAGVFLARGFSCAGIFFARGFAGNLTCKHEVRPAQCFSQCLHKAMRLQCWPSICIFAMPAKGKQLEMPAQGIARCEATPRGIWCFCARLAHMIPFALICSIGSNSGIEH